ncbi:MAG: 3-hydroxyacyl-ACP dehydratase FabZ [Lentisphaeria bacterium]
MGKVVGIKEIKEILPYSYPFLLIDRVQIFEDKIMALKALTINEEFFQGHFPGAPIMPGVLQIEAMLQAATLMLYNKTNCGKCTPFMTSLTKVKFRKPVLPGDQLVIEVNFDKLEGEELFVSANCLVNDQITSQAKFSLRALTEANALVPQHLINESSKSELPSEDILETEIDTAKLQSIIPHRYPFLLVDKLIGLSEERKEIIGLKNVSINEPFFSGLKDAVLPNSLQMEIAAQVGCYYMLSAEENIGKIGFFMSIDDAKFYKPVLPGDQLVIFVSLIGSKGRFGKGDVKIYVGHDLVTEGVVKFAIG